jgi:hypothetical protein
VGWAYPIDHILPYAGNQRMHCDIPDPLSTQILPKNTKYLDEFVFDRMHQEVSSGFLPSVFPVNEEVPGERQSNSHYFC